jgi:hypothetical protein
MPHLGDEAGRRRVRMRASALGAWVWVPTHEADAAVDEMAERLFLAGRLGVEIDDRRVAAAAQRAGGEFCFDRARTDRRARP